MKTKQKKQLKMPLVFFSFVIGWVWVRCKVLGCSGCANEFTKKINTSFGFWISDFGFWISDFGFWILERYVANLFVQKKSDFGFRILDCGFRILGFGFRILDFGFRILDFGFGTSLHFFGAYISKKILGTPTRVGGFPSS